MTNFTNWMETIGAAVTISAADGTILYMNERARKTYEKHGDLIGKNMLDCHNPRSRALIYKMLSTGETNTYTVHKGGIDKLIFQSPWRDEEGNIAGMAEISIPLPANMTHYDRDKGE